MEATKAIASMPPGHCLGAFEMLRYQFPHTVGWPQGKNTFVPLPFQKQNNQVWNLPLNPILQGDLHCRHQAQDEMCLESQEKNNHSKSIILLEWHKEGVVAEWSSELN